MKRIAILAAGLALAGCAYVEGGNRRGGVVTVPFGAAQGGVNAAEAHCARHGLEAEVTGVGQFPGQLLFRCR